MEQQVIFNFKMLYARALFRKCFEVTNETQLKLWEFCKDHFTKLNSLTLIDNAWTHVAYKTLNFACNFWGPDEIAERNFERLESDDSALIDEVVSMGKSMGLEVKSEDVHELLKIHEIECNTEELPHLQEE